MNSRPLLLVILAAFSAVVYLNFQPLHSVEMSEQDKAPAPQPECPEGFEQITLGAGCFWCVEAVYNRLEGIHSAVSGYMGGKIDNPTYDEVCTGVSGHAEVVHVIYDPKKISCAEVLDWFWQLHDPTTLNRQGNDIGSQYRSAIYYYSDQQKKTAEASLAKAQADLDKKIVTEITKASALFPAENYHQDFYNLNGSKNGYCRAVITPKMKKLNLEGKPKLAK